MFVLPKPEPWIRQAACDGIPASVFFPPTKGRLDPYREAKSVCAVCPVVSACLDYALRCELNGRMRVGMFGGLAPSERDAIARSLQSA